MSFNWVKSQFCLQIYGFSFYLQYFSLTFFTQTVGMPVLEGFKRSLTKLLQSAAKLVGT